jgi:hypothetical protein
MDIAGFNDRTGTCATPYLKWSHLLGQFCGLAKMHLVCVHAAFRVFGRPKFAMSGVRL